MVRGHESTQGALRANTFGHGWKLAEQKGKKARRADNAAQPRERIPTTSLVRTLASVAREHGIQTQACTASFRTAHAHACVVSHCTAHAHACVALWHAVQTHAVSPHPTQSERCMRSASVCQSLLPRPLLPHRESSPLPPRQFHPSPPPSQRSGTRMRWHARRCARERSRCRHGRARRAPVADRLPNPNLEIWRPGAGARPTAGRVRNPKRHASRGRRSVHGRDTPASVADRTRRGSRGRWQLRFPAP